MAHLQKCKKSDSIGLDMLVFLYHSAEQSHGRAFLTELSMRRDDGIPSVYTRMINFNKDPSRSFQVSIDIGVISDQIITESGNQIEAIADYSAMYGWKRF